MRQRKAQAGGEMSAKQIGDVDVGSTESAEEKSGGDLALYETTRVSQAAIGLLVQADWKQVPEILAFALAIHRMLEDEAPRIRADAMSILQRPRQKPTS